MDILTVRIILAGVVLLVFTILGIGFFKKKPILKALCVSVVAAILFYLAGYVLDSILNKGVFGIVSLVLAPLFNGGVFTAVFMAIASKKEVSTKKTLLPDKTMVHELFTQDQAIIIGPSLLVLLELILLFLFLFEGSICILMAAPFLWVFTVIGSLIAYNVLKNRYQRFKYAFLNLFIIGGLLPIGQSIENHYFNDPYTSHVTTSLVIDAPIESVFRYVAAFPLIQTNQLESTGDVLFAIGLPEPRYAKLLCKDADCKTKIRYCVFTQKTHFVEPVTVYNPPYELTFSVSSKVGKQDKLTGVDTHIRPGGHYFDNYKGQFLLKSLTPNKTLIQGTTWYRLNTPLTWYAKPWTEYILHTIHLKVMHHIESLVKSPAQKTSS